MISIIIEQQLSPREVANCFYWLEQLRLTNSISADPNEYECQVSQDLSILCMLYIMLLQSFQGLRTL